MSGMEVVAVIGCVAAVVSAYKDGGQIVKQIKAKRAAKKAPPPTVTLETSLERGPPAVEQAKDNGIERYGPKFATGDAIATQALQEILIHLQGTLLRHLWAAQENDNLTDFNIVVDASDFGRIKSVTVLNELYMRMAQAAPIQRQLPDMERVHTLPTTSGSSLPWETDPSSPWEGNANSLPSAQSRSILRAQPRGSVLSSSPTNSAGTQDPIEPPSSTGKKWGIPFRSRTPRGFSNPPRDSDVSSSRTTSKEQLSKSPHGSNIEGSATSTWELQQQTPIGMSSTQDHSLERPSSGSWKPSPEMRIDEDNPWREEASVSSIDKGVLDAPDHQDTLGVIRGPPRRSTEQTFVNDDGLRSPEVKPPHVPSPLHSPSASQTRLVPNRTASIEGEVTSPKPRGRLTNMFRRTSSEITQVEDKKPPLKRLDNSRKSLPRVPRNDSTPEAAASAQANDPYGGFCKGAYKLQVGLVKEGMRICNQSTSMTGQANYWACASSKCCFEGPACKVGKIWKFDNSVRTMQGVRYRWTLLAKSHVAMSKVTNRIYAFRCLFCSEQGQPTNIYHGDKVFLDHIWTHQEQSASLLSSEKIICRSGRMALDHEVFDVNFPPSVETAQFHGRTLVNSPNIDKISNDHTDFPEGEEFFEWSTPEASIDSSPWQN